MQTRQGNPEEDEKEVEDIPIEKENGKDSESTSGDFKYRHHEVHRTILYVQDETTVSIPLRYDVMSLTRTRMDNASEHTLNDNWNDEREVLLAEKSNDTMHFQMFRSKLPGGYKMGERSTPNMHL